LWRRISLAFSPDDQKSGAAISLSISAIFASFDGESNVPPEFDAAVLQGEKLIEDLLVHG
jgi:hypothetical protein